MSDRVQLAPRFVSWKFAPLFKQFRFKVYYGGRGGAKSTSFADALLTLAAQKKLRILCAREIQKSIHESVHALLVERMAVLGYQSLFEVTKTEINCKNGSEIFFAGLRTNVNEVKSMQGIDICWVEEAQAVSKQSWKILIPTIRKSGSEIWVSFNPDQEDDATYSFVREPRPNSVVVKVGWEDNPKLDAQQLLEKDYMYRVDPETAANVWGGECSKISNAQIFGGRRLPDGTMTPAKYIVEDFSPGPDWSGPYFGGDFGFSTDPAAFVKCWVHDNRLYIEHEAYGHGVETDQLFNLLDSIPDAIVRAKLLATGEMVHVRSERPGTIVLYPEQWYVRCDNSRPETISFLQRQGLFAVAAKKWAGSVEDGVGFLRAFEQIVIHPRCKHMEQEARLYRYKIDRITGMVLPIIVDANNHLWDAVRYALQPMISHDVEEAVITVDAARLVQPHALDLLHM